MGYAHRLLFQPCGVHLHFAAFPYWKVVWDFRAECLISMEQQEKNVKVSRS